MDFLFRVEGGCCTGRQTERHKIISVVQNLNRNVSTFSFEHAQPLKT